VKDFLAISVAAIFGANLRYLLGRLSVKHFGLGFPYGTLAINIIGSFIVGLFVIWTTERVLIDSRWRLLVVVGFCGSFTTFSSYAYESMSFLEHGQWGMMLLNILGNNLLCLCAALAGMALARVL
jgi:CrcB protein